VTSQKAPADARPRPPYFAGTQKVRYCTTLLSAIVMPAASRTAVRAKVTLFCQVICCLKRGLFP
jgi:hypothetical protein